MFNRIIIAVLILLTPLASSLTPAFGQRERMNMSEAMTPQIVRKGEVAAPPDKPRPDGVDVFRGTKRVIEKPIIEDLRIKENNQK